MKCLAKKERRSTELWNCSVPLVASSGRVHSLGSAPPKGNCLPGKERVTLALGLDSE
jgi:hypothetical protein